MKTTFWDGKLKYDLLKNYVYALVDPIDDNIFYVGLAGGDEGKGNNRPDHHLDETKKALNAVNGNHAELKKEKHRKIAAIWKNGQEPKLIIVRRNLVDRLAAIHVEAALIDLLNHMKPNGIALTNDQTGHGKEGHSIITDKNRSVLLAEKVKPTSIIRNVWLFPIKQGLESRSEDAYEATRKYWSINTKNCQIGEYAVGIADGISKVVIKINSWKQVDFEGKNKKIFEGDLINETDLGLQLLEKDFSGIVNNLGYWQRGRPIKIDFIESNKAKVIIGSKENEIINLSI